MTKAERLIEYLNSMSDSDLVYPMIEMCYRYNFCLDYWQSMQDFDGIMGDVEPSYVVKLVLDAGDDFDIDDEFFITDKTNYLYSGDIEDVADWIRKDIPEYAKLIVEYGIQNIIDDGINSIFERGDN